MNEMPSNKVKTNTGIIQVEIYWYYGIITGYSKAMHYHLTRIVEFQFLGLHYYYRKQKTSHHLTKYYIQLLAIINKDSLDSRTKFH